MLDIDISLVVQIVNLLLLLVVMNAILYRPLRKIMAERNEKFLGLEREIEGLTKNANQKLEDFKAKLQDANLKGGKERETLKNEGMAEEKKLTSKAREEAEGYKVQIIAQIKQDMAKAKEQLKGQLSGFASEMAAKLLGRAI